MPKIKVKTNLHNITEDKYFADDVVGIKSNNSIKYIDDSVVVILEIKDDEISLSRRAKDYTIDMTFVENKITKGLYMYKGLGNLNLNVETKSIIKKDNYIEIMYNMILDNQDKQEFEFKLEIEEI